MSADVVAIDDWNEAMRLMASLRADLAAKDAEIKRLKALLLEDPMNMTIDQLIQSGVDHARRVLIGQPGVQLTPSFVVQFKDRAPAFIETPWSSDDEKIAATEAMRIVFKRYRQSVHSYLFWSEAWRAHEDMKHPIGLAPRDREDREEVVMINAFDHKGGKMTSLIIERDDKGVVIDLIRDKDVDDCDRFEGRLYNLLKDD